MNDEWRIQFALVINWLSCVGMRTNMTNVKKEYIVLFSWEKKYKYYFQRIVLWKKMSSLFFPKKLVENWNKWCWQGLSSDEKRIENRQKGNWPWLTSSFVALESIDLSRRKTWLSPWDAKSSRQIGLTRLYCPHGTTQIIQPRRRLQIYGKVSCNWGNWKEEEEDREVEEAQNEENSGEKSLLISKLAQGCFVNFCCVLN